MVISELVIYNNALNLLGVEEVASVNESSRAASVLRVAYSLTKEALLRSHFWNFSIKRVTLSPDTTPPAFGFTNSFSLPSDALVWRFYDTNLVAKQEGRKLLSDASSIQLIYVSNSVSEADFDPIFTKCLATKLAIDTCHKLTQNVALKQEIQTQFKDLLIEAKRMNAISQTPDGLIIDTFVNGRL